MELVIKHLESELSMTKQHLFENDQKKSVTQYNPHKASIKYSKELQAAIDILKKRSQQNKSK